MRHVRRPRGRRASMPVCVEACPLRALDFGDIDELREKYGDVADLAPLPDSSERPEPRSDRSGLRRERCFRRAERARDPRFRSP